MMSTRYARKTLPHGHGYHKNLPEHYNQNKKRIWKALSSKMIKGAKIGIVRLGSIGLEVAKIAKA